jgi:hypothetical protein
MLVIRCSDVLRITKGNLAVEFSLRNLSDLRVSAVTVC